MKFYTRTVPGKNGRKRRVLCADKDAASEENSGDRGDVRSKYLTISNLINDKRDDISGVDVESSNKFRSIMNEVDQLHRSVSKPREQVADAEALLNLTDVLVTSVKSYSSGGVTPSEFISCLLNDYATTVVTSTRRSLVHWQDLGFDVSPVFMRFDGCTTMVGPMENQLKRRKTPVRKPRTRRPRPSKSCLKELDHSGEGEKAGTEKNMATMFEILKKKRRVGLECLILNRKCFAQTVENLFALSFLVKDGRVQITIDTKGRHIVSPRNAPTARSIQSGRAVYEHFVFRCDFNDWKLMLDYVPAGEELMPHRQYSDDDTPSCLETPPHNSSEASKDESRIQQTSVGTKQPPVSDEGPDVEIIQPNEWKNYRFKQVYRQAVKARVPTRGGRAKSLKIGTGGQEKPLAITDGTIKSGDVSMVIGNKRCRSQLGCDEEDQNEGSAEGGVTHPRREP